MLVARPSPCNLRCPFDLASSACRVSQLHESYPGRFLTAEKLLDGRHVSFS